MMTMWRRKWKCRLRRKQPEQEVLGLERNRSLSDVLRYISLFLQVQLRLPRGKLAPITNKPTHIGYFRWDAAKRPWTTRARSD